jgi:hypothetical protein
VKITKSDVFFYASLVLALWFALAGMVWAYYAALFIAYPFGIISFILWRIIRKEGRKRIRILPIVLGTGLTLSLVALVSLLIWG